MKNDEQTQQNAKYFTRLDSGEWVFHHTPCITPFTLLLTTEEQKDHMLHKWNEFQALYDSSKEQELSFWDSYMLEVLFMPISAAVIYYIFTPLVTILLIFLMIILWMRAELKFKKYFSEEITLYSSYSLTALKKTKARSFVSSVEVMYSAAKFILILGVLALIGSQYLSNDATHSMIKLLSESKDWIFWSGALAVTYGLTVITRLKRFF